MSRSGYSDDCDGWALIRWRGAVESAIRGARGQAALRELLAALDAMPVKALAPDSLVTAEGEFCTLGALGRARGMDMTPMAALGRGGVAKAFGIAPALAAEIMSENDDDFDCHLQYVPADATHFRGQYLPESPEQRYSRMREWVAKQIREP